MSLDLSTIDHHPVLEAMVDVLCTRTQNQDRGFFRTEVAYFLAKMASSMRASIVTKDRGEIPVNMYALALATSGYGKGHSVTIVEQEFLKGFRSRFMDESFPVIAEQNLWVVANDRAARDGTDQQEEFDKAKKEFRQTGAYPFTFDSATPPAVKQLREKLLMAQAGSINLQIDEIGSNLLGVTDVLTLFLELYDQGLVKQKLTKNTTDNQRGEELDGKTPTNMLLFGTPSKLLDGGQIEDAFYSFLDTGYARRCLFGYGQHNRTSTEQTAAEIYAQLTEPKNEAAITQLARHFYTLADPTLFNYKMEVADEVSIALLDYRIDCEKRAEILADHEEIKKAEMAHRYFKALKLAGAYAFVDQSTEVLMEHLTSAIKLVEESGAAFQTILSREKTYVKLAKFISGCKHEQTHADLTESLPFYPKGLSARKDMMELATAWGYKNHIIIKKQFIDNIEFFSGESLNKTDLNKMTVSYSENWAYDYLPERVPFHQLHTLTQAPGFHWANHHFKAGHRAEENVIQGFNMIVIDVDHGVTLETAQELLKDYKFLTYTTKRHQTEGHGDRFRIILPINYELSLDHDDYKEFMDNIMAWLPFESDISANQRAKKWETFDGGQALYNLEGEILDVLPFIPKTSRNDQLKAQSAELGSLDNLERWFAGRIVNGNRNNQMIKYALCLVDAGWDLASVRSQVHAFNSKLSNAMSEQEIDSTIMVTVAKRFTN